MDVNLNIEGEWKRMIVDNIDFDSVDAYKLWMILVNDDKSQLVMDHTSKETPIYQLWAIQNLQSVSSTGSRKHPRSPTLFRASTAEGKNNKTHDVCSAAKSDDFYRLSSGSISKVWDPQSFQSSCQGSIVVVIMTIVSNVETGTLPYVNRGNCHKFQHATSKHHANKFLRFPCRPGRNVSLNFLLCIFFEQLDVPGRWNVNRMLVQCLEPCRVMNPPSKTVSGLGGRFSPNMIPALSLLQISAKNM